jgi:hypothetical protein
MTASLKATGYDPNEYFFATRYQQGGRTVYSLDFSVRELVTFLPKPDPDKPLDATSTQRRIVPTHARDFGTYVRQYKEWVSPALLLRAPDIFEFTDALPDLDTGTTKFGQLGVPKDAKSEISIVDGQHRTLGFHLAWEMLTEDISKARASLAAAKQTEETAVIQHHQKVLEKNLARRDQLAAERVSVQIVVVDTPDVARRIFVDINDNAKGITGAVRSRFDDRKVISRALNRVLTSNHLLDGRVDLEQDRVSGSSQYLLGAKHVADILRAITVGHGRISKRLEEELSDQKMAADFDDFIAALIEAFPALGKVESGDLSPAELRSQSLIGSNVMLRGFAAAWYELKEAGWTEDDITKAWATFDPYMSAPVYTDPRDTWYASGLFPATIDGANSPTSRIQDFKALSQYIGDLSEDTDTIEWFRATKTDPKAL